MVGSGLWKLEYRLFRRSMGDDESQRCGSPGQGSRRAVESRALQQVPPCHQVVGAMPSPGHVVPPQLFPRFDGISHCNDNDAAGFLQLPELAWSTIIPINCTSVFNGSVSTMPVSTIVPNVPHLLRQPGGRATSPVRISNWLRDIPGEHPVVDPAPRRGRGCPDVADGLDNGSPLPSRQHQALAPSPRSQPRWDTSTRDL